MYQQMHDVHNVHGCFREDKFHLEPRVWCFVLVLLSFCPALFPCSYFRNNPWCLSLNRPRSPLPTSHGLATLSDGRRWSYLSSAASALGTGDKVVNRFKVESLARNVPLMAQWRECWLASGLVFC